MPRIRSIPLLCAQHVSKASVHQLGRFCLPCAWLTQTRQLNMLESDSHVSFGDSGCGKLSRQLNLCKSKFLEV